MKMEPIAMHGGDRVGAALAAHGVRFVFTLCGGHISPILTASKARGIRIIDVRDEATAVFAADAVASSVSPLASYPTNSLPASIAAISGPAPPPVTRFTGWGCRRSSPTPGGWGTNCLPSGEARK